MAYRMDYNERSEFDNIWTKKLRYEHHWINFETTLSPDSDDKWNEIFDNFRFFIF